MLKNLLKISFRNIVKNTSHTIINVLGLSIGISSAIVIFLILRFDLSFDQYHSDSDQVYRLVKHEITSGKLEYDVGIPYPLRLSFQEEFPEVELLTYIDNNSLTGLVAVEQNGKKVKFDENSLHQAFVMPDFFKIFDYQFILGDPQTALVSNYSVVLSKSMAIKYFDDYTKAMGKTLNIENYFDLTVTGIIEDPPMNTDLPFKMLMSFDIGGEQRIWDSWTATSSSVQTFVKLKEGANADNFGRKIEGYIEAHDEPGDPRVHKLLVQPLADMHFNQHYTTYPERIVAKEEIYTLAAVGFLMMVIACINFINLNTAMVVKRSKEIGVRKVLGSGRPTLIFQFLCETALIALTAVLLSLGLAELFALRIEYIIGFDLPSTIYDLPFFMVLIGIFLGVTLLSGLYPAMIVSGFKPINALKNKINISYKRGFSVRGGLIVIQLIVSQVLIVAVIVVSQQIRHFMSEPIGVNTEAVVEFSVPDPSSIDMELFKERIAGIKGVERITFSNTGTTSNNSWGGILHFDGGERVIDEDVQIKLIDDSYLDTYGLTLLAGRNLSSNSDTVRTYLINEEAVKAMGFQEYNEALGHQIEVWGTAGDVVGVVKNFNTMSLHYGMEPVAFWPSTNASTGAIKVKDASSQETIMALQKEWESQFPEHIFSYSFLDDDIAKYYENERRVSKTFSVFATLTIIIGCIGLLGLMSYMVNTRTKEIGVRKVLGAKVSQIIAILSSDFMKLVLIAFALAAPLSWYLMSKWLQDFESKITLSYWIFLLALAFSLLVTLLTVGFKSFKAAIVNPVEVLKDE